MIRVLRSIYINGSSNNLAKYLVDGKLIADNDPKCDFLILNCERCQSYFIELKGSDIIHAFEQINRTIDLLRPDLANFSLFARIMLTKVSTVGTKSTQLVKLAKKLKALNGNLKYKTRVLEDVV